MTKEVRSPVTELDPSKFRTMPLVIAMQENSIKLLVEAMHEVGPAAQTLGGILRLTLRCTFASQSKISIASGLPLKTVRKHLLTLQEHSFIHNNGREPTQSGRARRTCTIRSTGRTLEVVKNYCPLPWWTAATSVGNQWCSRALRAVVVRRWLELRAGIITTYRGEPFHEHELPDRLNSIGGEERFGFSLPKLQKMTGLSRDSIVKGKRILTQAGFVSWIRGADSQSPDLLIPNWGLKVIEENIGNGRFRIHLRGGPKNGQ